ncbi:hypothetical protein BP6252_11339 [Coleophoma cylindrospora]|uniref:Uncharacterized protein n=1 Tax=Coleophoma cylindrospora TaxID=1849047 RepID=A0A3D8QQM6_9HELO|nr:hypothetical protein BP6252_11339 [Coleophoma cylindrospora]
MAVSTSAATVAVPTPSYLFSATVNLGKNLDPIPLLEGGTRIVEPITGGTISGPAFNATIEGGLAAPIIIRDDTGNGTKAQMAFIYAYGHASDGSPFYIDESGVGTGSSQTTRLIIQVGGQYQDLQSKYVLGQPSVNAARTVALVECFSVPLPV